MGKRKTIKQRELEETLKKELNELGRKITIVAARNSKVSKKQKSHLRDSMNYRVKPFNTLVVSQRFYGQYNTPKGKSTPGDRSNIKDNPMLNAIEKHIPEGVKVSIQELTDLLISPVIKR